MRASAYSWASWGNPSITVSSIAKLIDGLVGDAVDASRPKLWEHLWTRELRFVILLRAPSEILLRPVIPFMFNAITFIYSLVRTLNCTILGSSNYDFFFSVSARKNVAIFWAFLFTYTVLLFRSLAFEIFSFNLTYNYSANFVWRNFASFFLRFSSAVSFWVDGNVLWVNFRQWASRCSIFSCYICSLVFLKPR